MKFNIPFNPVGSYILLVKPLARLPFFHFPRPRSENEREVKQNKESERAANQLRNRTNKLLIAYYN